MNSKSPFWTIAPFLDMHAIQLPRKHADGSPMINRLKAARKKVIGFSITGLHSTFATVTGGRAG